MGGGVGGGGSTFDRSATVCLMQACSLGVGWGWGSTSDTPAIVKLGSRVPNASLFF